MQIRKMVAALAAILAGVVSLAAWAETTEVPEGLTAQASYDGLLRVEDSQLGKVYIKPDLVFDNRYSKILVDDRVPISYKSPPRRSSRTTRSRSSSSNFALTDDQKLEMERMFLETLLEALGETENLVLTDAAGPGVLFIQAELVDLVIRIPTTASVGRSSYWVTEIGDVTLVLELRDSQTNEIFVRAIDRRSMTTIGPNGTRILTPASAKPDVRRLFKSWATFLAERLDLIKQVVIDAAAE